MTSCLITNTISKSGEQPWARDLPPHNANIFMAEWEQQALQKVPHKPENWDRFLDDCFLIWNHGEDQLQNFFNILNNDHPAVKLKFESSADSVDFLDVTVFKGKHVETKGHLSTKLYRKPTDTMELLHTQSYHPAHTFDGIVKSQILRFQRLCTEEEDFNKSCDQLFQALIPRNYTNTKLRKIKKDTIQNIGKPKSQYKKHHQALLQQPSAGVYNIQVSLKRL